MHEDTLYEQAKPMTAQELTLYIQSRYGVCNQIETTGKCPCLYYAQDQRLCSDYVPTTATTWEELAKLAQARYSENKHES